MLKLGRTAIFSAWNERSRKVEDELLLSISRKDHGQSSCCDVEPLRPLVRCWSGSISESVEELTGGFQSLLLTLFLFALLFFTLILGAFLGCLF